MIAKDLVVPEFARLNAGEQIREWCSTRGLPSARSAANIKSRIIDVLVALLLHLSEGLLENVSDERVLSCALEVDPFVAVIRCFLLRIVPYTSLICSSGSISTYAAYWGFDLFVVHKCLMI